MTVEIPTSRLEPDPQARPHPITQPQAVRRLWFAGCGILAVTVVAEPFVHLHPHFGFDGWFGFHAWYGFLTCVAMVVFAKVLGIFLKREDRYYGD